MAKVATFAKPQTVIGNCRTTMQDDNNVKILFQFHSDIFDEEMVETMWATTVDKDKRLYKLDNIPFYAPLVASDDMTFNRESSCGLSHPNAKPETVVQHIMKTCAKNEHPSKNKNTALKINLGQYY